ncbi:hypothetical protein [Deinococcus navajonensis]|uniref:Uncharacterized protein n=1 Tax=Deinococcus navajonensis TaxID=309884 RepID=A0ABV8XR62_9DEIO
MVAVTVQEVAAYAPEAPAVTDAQLVEARDWAEPLLERYGIVLIPNTRLERAAKRAVMNYALHLAVRNQASSFRTQNLGILQERDKIGDLENEVRYAAPVDTATGYLLSAAEFLTRAWQGLWDAGVPRPLAVPGASR